MNNKAQITVALILGVFISVIVGLTLITGSYPFIGTATNSLNLINSTFTAPAAGSSVDLTGQELLNTPIVTNRTGGAVVPASNYTIGERISPVDGLKRIYYQSNGGVFNSVALNVSYSYGPEGYIDDAGGRGVTNLIPIMAAIALVVVLVALVVKEKLF